MNEKEKIKEGGEVKRGPQAGMGRIICHQQSKQLPILGSAIRERKKVLETC